LASEIVETEQAICAGFLYGKLTIDPAIDFGYFFGTTFAPKESVMVN
jgi:hypothetical protein